MPSENSSKSDDRTSNNKIHLQILGQDGVLMSFDVKRNKPLRILLQKYCDHKKFEYSAMNFLFHGSRVLKRGTPEENGLKDGDVIEALGYVDGGGDVKVI